MRIIKEPLPAGMNGASTKQGDTVTIVINADNNQGKQTTAFIHEMLHVWHGDHDRGDIKNVQQLEAQRHKETERLQRMTRKRTTATRGGRLFLLLAFCAACIFSLASAGTIRRGRNKQIIQTAQTAARSAGR